MSQISQNASSGEVSDNKLVFTGTVRGLYPIFLVNLALTIVTLGIYRFWAKTRSRKYIWGHLSLYGDPLEYTGTGRELFFGFLIILVTVLLPLVALSTIAGILQKSGHNYMAGLLNVIYFLAIYYLIGVGTFAALRYRLTRTQWRGIRGGMEGSALQYGFFFLTYALGAIVTLGVALPWMQIRHLSQLYNRASFGSEKFSFNALIKPLMKSWLVVYFAFFGLLIAIGGGVFVFFPDLVNFFTNHTFGRNPSVIVPQIIWTVSSIYLAAILLGIWYQAKFISYVYSHLSLSGLKFRYDITAWRLLSFILGNLLILICTLGLGMPFITIRSVRFVTNNVSILGGTDVEAVVQSTETMPKFGEGLAAAFDIGAV